MTLFLRIGLELIGVSKFSGANFLASNVSRLILGFPDIVIIDSSGNFKILRGWKTRKESENAEKKRAKSGLPRKKPNTIISKAFLNEIYMFNIEISSDNNVRKQETGNKSEIFRNNSRFRSSPILFSAIYKEMGWNSGRFNPSGMRMYRSCLNRLTQEIKKFQILASNSEKQKKEVIDELQNILKEKTGDEKDDLIKSLESKLNKQREITIAMSATFQKDMAALSGKEEGEINQVYEELRKLKEEKISLEEKLNTQKTIHLKSSSSFNEQINLLNEQLQAKQAELDSIKEKGVAEVPKEQSLDMDNIKKENDELKDKIQSNKRLLGKRTKN